MDSASALATSLSCIRFSQSEIFSISMIFVELTSIYVVSDDIAVYI